MKPKSKGGWRCPRFVSAGLVGYLVCTICLALPLRAESTGVLGSTFYAWDALASTATNTGSVRRVIDAPTPTLNRLTLHISTLNPGPEVPHHHHPNEEVSLIKEGSVRYWANGKIYDAGAGSMVFLSADAVHTPFNVGKEPAVYYVITVYTDATPRTPGPPADEWAAPGALRTSLFKCDQLPSRTTESGSRREIVSSRTATLANLESELISLNPGADTGISSDPADELIFIRTGLLEIRIKGVTGRLGPGSFCFKASNDELRVKNIASLPAVYQVLRFATARTPAIASR